MYIFCEVLFLMDSMSKPYQHIRFRWWNAIDLDEASGELKKTFKVDHVSYTKDPSSLYNDDKSEVIVKSDTLTAYLSLFRAVLSQEKSVPFTEKDLVLREKIRKYYSHDRPTPFPWEFNPEPKI